MLGVDPEGLFCGLSRLLSGYLPDLFPTDCMKLLETQRKGAFHEVQVRLVAHTGSKPCDLRFLIPGTDDRGFFGFRDRVYTSPLVLVERRERFFQDQAKVSSKTTDLRDFFVIPGFFLIGTLELSRWMVKELASNSKLFSDEMDRTRKLNQILSHLWIGSWKRWVFLTPSDEESTSPNPFRAIQIPGLQPFAPLNQLHQMSELRKVVYHGSKVSDALRKPHPSHLGCLDMLETPESEDIGLTLFMCQGARYDAGSLEIQPDLYADPLGKLSLSSACVPFMHFSDGARVSMGGKNLKQAVQVVGAEAPMVKTGVEEATCLSLGVNARVFYQLHEGLTFEDGIVVSQSFAEKMAVRRVREIDTEIAVPWEGFRKRNQLLGARKESMQIEEEAATPEGPQKMRMTWDLRKGRVGKGQWLIRSTLELARCIQPGGKGRGNAAEFDRFRSESSKNLLQYEDGYPGRILGWESQLLSLRCVRDGSRYVAEARIRLRVKVEQSCPLEIGDKLTGRHGNKGTISAILPDDEMPRALVDGKSFVAEVLISPMSVVSRLNLGQLLETHHALAYGESTIPPFAEYDPQSLLLKLQEKGADALGYFPVDGKPIAVGIQYLLRLNHFARDKMHVVNEARVCLLHDQPLKGKQHHGGQRIGEMEFWSLFSHGALGCVQSFAQTNDPSFQKDGQYLKTLGFFLSRYMNSNKKLKDRWDIRVLDADPEHGVRTEVSHATESVEPEIAPEVLDTLNQITAKKPKATLMGKQGFFRKHMLGRRIHRSGRAVITPVTDIDVDHVYLPVDFAIAWLAGSDPSFDARKIKKALQGDSEARKSIAGEMNERVASSKWMVILNRQPSLHRHSMQAFYPLFWAHYTIGFPILVCDAMGADFDGDTMAVYFPFLQMTGTKAKKASIRKELEGMTPSQNPFRLGNRKSAWSLSQDLVYARYCEGVEENQKASSALLKEIELAVDAKAPASSVSAIQRRLLDTLKNHPLSISFFDIAAPLEEGLYMPHFIASEARGKKEQLAQIRDCIQIRNLGEPHNRILASSFTTGVPFQEYFFDKALAGIASRSRTGLMDKKLKVATAGYLTRKLVEFLYPLRIGIKDCGTQEGVSLSVTIVQELEEKGMGLDRVVQGRMVSIEGSKERMAQGEWISEMKKAMEAKKSVQMRSPVTCKAILDGGVCACCYGVDLAKPALSESFLGRVGDFVGLSAGHVIGECSTQLAMKTFQTGKEFSVQALSARLFALRGGYHSYWAALNELLSEEAIRSSIIVHSIHFEILFAWLNRQEIDSESDMKKMMADVDRVGLFTALSFEKTTQLLDKLSRLEKGEVRQTTECSPKAVIALAPDCVEEVFRW